MIRKGRLAPFLLVLLAVAACRSTLDPVVPAGQAAYGSIEGPAQEVRDSAYLLQSGDKISVTVFQEPDLSVSDIEIDGSGLLNLPLIGSVAAAGRSQAELAGDIEQAYARRYLRNPRVAISIVEATPRVVSVEGEVNQPGAYELKPGATLLAALAMARSPTATAKLDQVIVFRTLQGQRMGGRFDLQAIRSGSAPDPQMMDGDVVVVGYSRAAGIWNDILRAAPLFNTFVLLDNNR
ncbi:MAG: polysaccharide biosynthesis/export family protein [Novosphingobium sp.]